jgi:hypothetical protein
MRHLPMGWILQLDVPGGRQERAYRSEACTERSGDPAADVIEPIGPTVPLDALTEDLASLWFFVAVTSEVDERNERFDADSLFEECDPATSVWCRYTEPPPSED